jgi:hypothetical protein
VNWIKLAQNGVQWRTFEDGNSQIKNLSNECIILQYLTLQHLQYSYISPTCLHAVGSSSGTH